jgi:NAD(P)-dependent dehydrogenase (short-subunit alcohol dehydrogenase family)
MRLDRKLALVTGGAQGIGEATVRRLAAEGAQVIIADIDEGKGRALAEALGDPHRFTRLDVSDGAAWEALAGKIARGHDGLDIVFLNAGVTSWPVSSPHSASGLDALSSRLVEKILPVNLGGVAHGLAHCFPLAQAVGGTIVATASTAAIINYSADPIYTASKAGVIALVKSLAGELAAAGVRLCAVSPGSIDTQMYPENHRESRRAAGTLAAPDYLASAVMTILEQGQPGDLWIARPEDRGFWVYEPGTLPNVIGGDSIPAGARFVAADPLARLEPVA